MTMECFWFNGIDIEPPHSPRLRVNHPDSAMADIRRPALFTSNGEALSDEGSAYRVGGAAVSYTHLDVYKRQDPPLVAALPAALRVEQRAIQADDGRRLGQDRGDGRGSGQGVGSEILFDGHYGSFRSGACRHPISRPAAGEDQPRMATIGAGALVTGAAPSATGAVSL